jgi:hypothetical protein
MIGGGVVLLLLAFLYLRSRGGTSAATAPTDTVGTTTDPAASDYANLAGAAQQAGAQEQSDFGTLNSQIAALTGQESSDISGLTGSISGLESHLNNIPAGAAGPAGASGIGAGQYKKLQTELAKTLAAQQKQSRRLTQLINSQKQKQKTGHKNKASSDPHTSAHHPAGTAGSSVASRSHAPKTAAWKATTQAVIAPAMHLTAEQVRYINAGMAAHPASPPVKQPAKPPPAKKVKARR